jgi:hypothetical protein
MSMKETTQDTIIIKVDLLYFLGIKFISLVCHFQG